MSDFAARCESDRRFLATLPQFPAAELADIPDEDLTELVAGALVANLLAVLGRLLSAFDENRRMSDAVFQAYRALELFMRERYPSQALIGSRGVVFRLDHDGDLEWFNTVEV